MGASNDTFDAAVKAVSVVLSEARGRPRRRVELEASDVVRAAFGAAAKEIEKLRSTDKGWDTSSWNQSIDSCLYRLNGN